MAYVECHDCNTIVHFKPVNLNRFNERFIDGNEPIYCINCFRKREREIMNKEILEYLKYEKENLLLLVRENRNEFNQGRLYAMDKMIGAVEDIFFNAEDIIKSLNE